MVGNTVQGVLVIHSVHNTHHVTPSQNWINVNSPAPDPVIFVSGLQGDKLKIIFLSVFFYLLPYFYIHLYQFSKIESHITLGFSYYFCLMTEGSVPRTNRSRSGSRRPENIRTLRIRIRNTGQQYGSGGSFHHQAKIVSKNFDSYSYCDFFMTF